MISLSLLLLWVLLSCVELGTVGWPPKHSSLSASIQRTIGKGCIGASHGGNLDAGVLLFGVCLLLLFGVIVVIFGGVVLLVVALVSVVILLSLVLGGVVVVAG